MHTPLPRPKAILFDLFHTLVVLKPGAELGQPTWQALGVAREAWERVFYEDRPGRLTGQVRDVHDGFRALLAEMETTIPEDRLRHACALRQRRMENALLEPEAETVAALTALSAAGIRLALVSNAAFDEIGAWPRSPLAPLFDTTVFSCEIGVAKPDAGIYEEALTRIGCTAGESLFVGDGGSDEHRGARAVGLPTVLVTRYVRELWPTRLPLRREHADREVEDVPELARRILGEMP